MNRGFTNNKPSKTNKVVKKIKQYKPFQSWFNLFFIILILLFWLTSGCYYILGNQVALIFKDNNLIEYSEDVGLHYAYPAPFNSVQILDNTPISLTFKQDIELSESDIYLVQTTTKYKSNNYSNYANSLLQSSEEQINSIVEAIVISSVNEYFYTNSLNSISQINNIVLSTEIKDKINQNLSSYGLLLSELELAYVTKFTKESDLTLHIEKDSSNESIINDTFRSVERERSFNH